MVAKAQVLETADSNLSRAERAELASCETVLRRGEKAFLEVGAALAKIRDGRLYRAEYKRFEDYCREKWSYCSGYANILIRSAKLAEELEEAGLPPPKNPHQARMMLDRLGDVKNGARPPKPDGGAHRDHFSQQRMPELYPSIAKTARMQDMIDRLRSEHAGHPWQSRADELLNLYRDTVLPWPADPRNGRR